MIHRMRTFVVSQRRPHTAAGRDGSMPPIGVVVKKVAAPARRAGDDAGSSQCVMRHRRSSAGVG